MKKIDVETEAPLADLVEAVEAGESVVLLRNGRPVARMEAIAPADADAMLSRRAGREAGGQAPFNWRAARDAGRA